MAVTGDFARLAMLGQRLKRMAEGEARKELLHELASESHRLTVESFARKRDPYARSWPARKKPTGWAALAFGALEDSHPLLDKTGKLIDSVRSLALSKVVKITMLWYGVFHWQPDRSGKVIPQRTPLPTARQGLGPIWTQAFLAASGRVARRLGML